MCHLIDLKVGDGKSQCWHRHADKITEYLKHGNLFMQTFIDSIIKYRYEQCFSQCRIEQEIRIIIWFYIIFLGAGESQVCEVLPLENPGQVGAVQPDKGCLQAGRGAVPSSIEKQSVGLFMSSTRTLAGLKLYARAIKCETADVLEAWQQLIMNV